MIKTSSLVEVSFFNDNSAIGLVIEKEMWEDVEILKMMRKVSEDIEFCLTLYILIDKKVHILDFDNSLEFKSVIREIN
jgi:hypothetical protein